MRSGLTHVDPTIFNHYEVVFINRKILYITPLFLAFAKTRCSDYVFDRYHYNSIILTKTQWTGVLAKCSVSGETEL
jgi:hypothetical protein